MTQKTQKLLGQEFSQNILKQLRLGTLGCIGAISLLQEELRRQVAALVQRGESLEAKGRHFAFAVFAEVKAQVQARREAQFEKSGESNNQDAKTTQTGQATTKIALRKRVADWCLQQLGRPTVNETEQLKARIAELEALISKLTAEAPVAS